MVQFGTGQRAGGVIRLITQAGGTWLGCMGIFAGLPWLFGTEAVLDLATWLR
jgi:hypothetical protein